MIKDETLLLKEKIEKQRSGYIYIDNKIAKNICIYIKKMLEINKVFKRFRKRTVRSDILYYVGNNSFCVLMLFFKRNFTYQDESFIYTDRYRTFTIEFPKEEEILNFNIVTHLSDIGNILSIDDREITFYIKKVLEIIRKDLTTYLKETYYD